MKYRICAFIYLFLTLVASGQNLYTGEVWLNSSGTMVYVHENPERDSQVIDSIPPESFCISTAVQSDGWLECIVPKTVQGFVSDQNLTRFNSLEFKAQHAIVRKEIELQSQKHDLFLKRNLSRSEYGNHFRRRFLPVLQPMIRHISSSQDSLLLFKYLKLTDRQTGLASETIRNALGHIMTCRPNLLIHSLNVMDRPNLVQDAYFGLRNTIQNQNIAKYVWLKAKLDSAFQQLNCPGFWSNAPLKLHLPLKHKSLTLCTYEFDTSENYLGSFEIFNQNDSAIFGGSIQFHDAIQSFEPEFVIIESYSIPVDSLETFVTVPLFRFSLKEENKEVKIEREFLLQPRRIAQSRRDSLLNIFSDQPFHHGKIDPQNPPFIDWNYMNALFKCGLSGNEECMKAFSQIPEKYALDGALGETYGEYQYVLDVLIKSKSKQ